MTQDRAQWHLAKAWLNAREQARVARKGEWVMMLAFRSQVDPSGMMTRSVLLRLAKEIGAKV